MKRSIMILLLALAYTVAGKLGLKLAFVNASATAIWPPAGIALAALLVFGYEMWPGIFLGAFIVNFSTAGNLATSLAIAGGNTLEGLTGAYLVNRYAHGRDVFDHPYDVCKYIVFAVMGAPIVAATIGVTALVLGGFADTAREAPIWLTWWLGDAAGILIKAPVLILWSSRSRLSWNLRRCLEAAGATALTIVVGSAVFGELLPVNLTHFPLEFFCPPVILWVAFRFSQRETATASLVLAALAIWGTLHHSGPFASGSPNSSLLLLQTYLAVVSAMGLAVSAVVVERRRILRASESRFTRLMESNVIGLISVDPDGKILDANDAFLALVGYSREDLRSGRLNTHALTPPEYQAQEAWVAEQLHKRGSCSAIEKEFIQSDGTHVAVLVGGVQLERSPGRAICFVIDATSRRQAMSALREAYDEIELRVEERTKEITEVNYELAKEITRRQQAEAELRNISLQDPLTGLYNRRGFLALSEQQWLQAVRDKRPLLVFFADVDGLKTINDTLGHPRGDQAIVEASEVLRRTFRKSDILARIGGDEFAVVATQAPLDQAQAYLDRLQDHFQQVNAAGRLPFKLSLSVGVAMFNQDETTTIQELMRRADEDLYMRKRTRVVS